MLLYVWKPDTGSSLLEALVNQSHDKVPRLRKARPTIDKVGSLVAQHNRLRSPRARWIIRHL